MTVDARDDERVVVRVAPLDQVEGIYRVTIRPRAN
jgi:hypothetical protein